MYLHLQKKAAVCKCLKFLYFFFYITKISTNFLMKYHDINFESIITHPYFNLFLTVRNTAF